jgi:hypothetical protein
MLKCDDCGRFIPYADLENGGATHVLIYPDSLYTCETWETVCSRCNSRSSRTIASRGNGRPAA